LSVTSKLNPFAVLHWLRWLWYVGLVATAWFSLMPARTIGKLPGWDKTWHGGGYFALALPVCFLFATSRHSRRVLGGLIVFGALLECGQLYVPGRSFEWGDLLANSLGAVLGYLAGYWLLGLRQKLRP
jgi:VanZ family protein